MDKKFQRHDFLIKDLVVSIDGGSRGGTWLPGPDGETPPSPISPVAGVLVNIGIIETVRATVAEALESGKGLDSIGEAFSPDTNSGNPTIRSAIHDIGTAVIASAVHSALGSGSVGLPNPECGGTSLETIPTPITPVVNVGLNVHRVTELPRLRQQLKVAIDFVDKAASSQAPREAEVDTVRAHLKEALKSLS